MSLIESLKQRASSDLPIVTIEGVEFRVRTIKQVEYGDLIDDCLAYARAKTSEVLKGQTPNALKVNTMKALIKGQPEIANLIGQIDFEDAYSVAIAHAVTFSFAAMQCARCLTLADGTMAFSDIDSRIALVDELVKNESVIELISGAGKVEDSGKNELPEVSAD